MKTLALIALTACAAAPATAQHSSNVEGPPRVWLQAAIDAAAAGGTVVIPAGRWVVDRAPPGSYNRFAALSTHGHDITIRGVGPESVLVLEGDQGGASVAVISIDPGAAQVRITDLTIDTTGTTNTDEQTHAIATSGVCAGATCQPITDLSIERVTFRHPRNTAARKGDCIKLLGNTEETRLSGVRIVGNDFADCARSAVTIQGGVTDLVITANTLNATKTCIDGEATGDRTDARIAITGNVFRPGCSPALSLTSTDGATVSGNALAGAITVYRSTNVAIAGNAIDHIAADNAATIDVANRCDGLAISGNTIVRAGAAGPVIKLVPHAGVLCGGAAITGNTVRQGTVGSAILAEALSRASIADNLITYTVSAPAYGAIYDHALAGVVPIAALGITGNVISGDVGPSYAVTLDCSPGTCSAGINVASNTATNTVFGLRCNGPAANFTAPIVATGNAWGAAAYGNAQVVHGD